MQDLVLSLLNPDQVRPAEQLLKDTQTRSLIRKQLGQLLLLSKNVHSDPYDQLLVIASQADFATEDECVCVASIVYRYLPITEIFPMVTEHHGMDLGSRCLLALSFFQPAMQQPRFYRQAGRQGFYQADRHDLAKHFTNWEYFLNEMLPLST